MFLVEDGPQGPKHVAKQIPKFNCVDCYNLIIYIYQRSLGFLDFTVFRQLIYVYIYFLN